MSSRADAYAAFYRESRGRLLHQVYAYCGDGEVAQRALADAFVSAGHHWRKIADDPHKDAWVRERAFKATGRSLNRARKPWYVRALRTAEEHRAILSALQVLPPTDRKLVILVSMAGLDVPHAGREAGVTDDAAHRSLATSALVLSEFGGLDGTPEGIRAGLGSLRSDLTDEPIDRASRLRREGNRRRRSHMGLAALCSVAVVIGAGALTAQQPERVSAEGTESSQTTTPQRTDPSDLPAPAEKIDASVLTPLSAVAKMKYANPWRLTDTSTDFGTTAPYDECLQAVPQDKRAAHFYVRTFQSGRGQHPSIATESMEVSANIQAAFCVACSTMPCRFMRLTIVVHSDAASDASPVLALALACFELGAFAAVARSLFATGAMLPARVTGRGGASCSRLSGLATPNASMRSNTISKPARASGASSKSRRPMIAI